MSDVWDEPVLKAEWRDRAVQAEAEREASLARAQTAEAEADDLRRQLLDESYRPEGGEIVMRELSNVKAERDEARRLAQSNADTAREYHEELLDAHAERDTLAARLAAVREIHRPEFDPGRRGRQVCSECLGYTSPVPSRIGYPCQTVRALDVPLGTPEGETAKCDAFIGVGGPLHKPCHCVLMRGHAGTHRCGHLSPVGSPEGETAR